MQASREKTSMPQQSLPTMQTYLDRALAAKTEEDRRGFAELGLEAAVLNLDTDMAKRFLALGANASGIIKRPNSPMYLAHEKGLQQLDQLLNVTQDRVYRTVVLEQPYICYAIEHENPEMLRALLEHGADPKARNTTERNIYTAVHRQLETIREKAYKQYAAARKEAQRDYNDAQREYDRKLRAHYNSSYARGMESMSDRLIGAPDFATTRPSYIAPDFPATTDKEKLLTSICEKIQAGPADNRQGFYFHSFPLHQTISRGNVAMTQALLEHGAKLWDRRNVSEPRAHKVQMRPTDKKNERAMQDLLAPYIRDERRENSLFTKACLWVDALFGPKVR